MQVSKTTKSGHSVDRKKSLSGESDCQADSQGSENSRWWEKPNQYYEEQVAVVCASKQSETAVEVGAG